MSEESSDYIDHRTFFRRFINKGIVRVLVTKHAINRLRERATREYPKATLELLLDVIRNIIRDGYYRLFTDRIVIWTKRYVLICEIIDEHTIIVKTVISKVVLRDEFKRLLTKGRRVFWKKIHVECTHNHLRG